MTVAQRILPYKETDPDGTFDSRYYRKAEVDQKVADATTGEHDHDDRYYTKPQTDAVAAATLHDDRYYTETETDAKLAGPLTPSSLVAAQQVQVGTDLIHKGTKAGFFNATPATKPSVAGGRRGNPALASLLTALAGLGLVTNTTTDDATGPTEKDHDNTADQTLTGTGTITRDTVTLGPLQSGRIYVLDMEGMVLGEGVNSNTGDARYALEAAGIETYTTPEAFRFEQGVDATQAVRSKAIVTGTGASITVNYKVIWAAGDFTIKFSRLVASVTPVAG